MAGVDLDDRKYVPLLGCDSEVDEVLEVYFLSYLGQKQTKLTTI